MKKKKDENTTTDKKEKEVTHSVKKHIKKEKQNHKKEGVNEAHI